MDRAHVEVSEFLARCAVPRGAPLLAAVSGGADSMALFAILDSIGQRLGVAHVQHGLRGEAAERDLDFVRERARARGVAFHFARVDAARRDGRSPEARARALRYAALEELRARHGYRALATAHTLDDQAETVMLRATRGSGPLGLAAIRAASADGRLLRPLLGVRRGALRRYLRARGVDWREDESNAELSLPRNRLRAQVMPALEQMHPGASLRLAALAADAASLEAWLDERLAGEIGGAVRPGDGGIWVERGALQALPQPLRARALAGVLRSAGLAERVERRHLERLARFVASAPSGKRLSLPGRSIGFADRAALWVGPDPGPRVPPAFDAPLCAPLELALPERDTRLAWRRPQAQAGEAALVLPVPAAFAGELRARSGLPHDRVRAAGDARDRSLKDWFARARWSFEERARSIVVTWKGEIVWAVGLCRSAHLAGAAPAWELVARRLSTREGEC